MKKILLSAVSLLLLVSCSNDETSSSTDLATSGEHKHHRGCASHEVHEQQLRENPELKISLKMLLQTEDLLTVELKSLLLLTYYTELLLKTFL